MPTTTITRTTLIRTPEDAGHGRPAASVVVNFSLDANNNPVWSFDPPNVEMAAGRSVITFTLNTTTGFLFDNYFAPLTAQNAQFSPVLDATGTVLAVTDINTLGQGNSPVTIPYCVAVKNAFGLRYVSDPTIENDPPDPPMS